MLIKHKKKISYMIMKLMIVNFAKMNNLKQKILINLT